MEQAAKKTFVDLCDAVVMPGDTVVVWSDQGGRHLKVGKVRDVRRGRWRIYLVVTTIEGEDGKKRPSRVPLIIHDSDRVLFTPNLAPPGETKRVLAKIRLDLDPKKSLYTLEELDNEFD
jgi:hypothetical protein